MKRLILDFSKYGILWEFVINGIKRLWIIERFWMKWWNWIPSEVIKDKSFPSYVINVLSNVLDTKRIACLLDDSLIFSIRGFVQDPWKRDILWIIKLCRSFRYCRWKCFNPVSPSIYSNKYPTLRWCIRQTDSP